MGYEKTNRFVSVGTATSEVHRISGCILSCAFPLDSRCVYRLIQMIPVAVSTMSICVKRVQSRRRSQDHGGRTVDPIAAESQLLVAMASEMFPRPTTSRLSRAVAENSEIQVNVAVWWASERRTIHIEHVAGSVGFSAHPRKVRVCV